MGAFSDELLPFPINTGSFAFFWQTEQFFMDSGIKKISEKIREYVELLATFKSCGCSSGKRCKTMNYRLPVKPSSALVFSPLPKEMKRCQISGNSSLHPAPSDPAACCTLPTIWTFETQTSNPPFFSSGCTSS